MLNATDQLRARFSPNDVIRFKYRHKSIEGTLARCNPKRGVVLVDGQEYTVPYELLVQTAENTDHREERFKNVLMLAQELIALHGLKKWRFKFDHSTRRAGCCNYRDKMISIAFELARSGSDEDIRDTILHEIAHALAGRKHNHDAVWKAKAHEIGCTGERTHKLQFAPPRWSVTCENRCWTQTAQQRNSNLICRKCGATLIYTLYSAIA
ncbi:MAG: SprT-like domain-containing protein [Pontiella sp.]